MKQILQLLAQSCFPVIACLEAMGKQTTMTPRRFPAPWPVEQQGACFVVRDQGLYAPSQKRRFSVFQMTRCNHTRTMMHVQALHVARRERRG